MLVNHGMVHAEVYTSYSLYMPPYSQHAGNVSPHSSAEGTSHWRYSVPRVTTALPVRITLKKGPI